MGLRDRFQTFHITPNSPWPIYQNLGVQVGVQVKIGTNLMIPCRWVSGVQMVQDFLVVT